MVQSAVKASAELRCSATEPLLVGRKPMRRAVNSNSGHVRRMSATSRLRPTGCAMSAPGADAFLLFDIFLMAERSRSRALVSARVF
jgi:hypothetical protein